MGELWEFLRVFVRGEIGRAYPEPFYVPSAWLRYPHGDVGPLTSDDVRAAFPDEVWPVPGSGGL